MFQMIKQVAFLTFLSQRRKQLSRKQSPLPHTAWFMNTLLNHAPVGVRTRSLGHQRSLAEFPHVLHRVAPGISSSPLGLSQGPLLFCNCPQACGSLGPSCAGNMSLSTEPARGWPGIFPGFTHGPRLLATLHPSEPLVGGIGQTPGH